MLALFGAPYLDPDRGRLPEIAPLADGAAGRVPLHQLHPLLVHVCLFGAALPGCGAGRCRSALAGRG